jgi:hypothetical protein
MCRHAPTARTVPENHKLRSGEGATQATIQGGATETTGGWRSNPRLGGRSTMYSLLGLVSTSDITETESSVDLMLITDRMQCEP